MASYTAASAWRIAAADLNMWPPMMRFCSTVMCGSTRRPSITCTRPARTTAAESRPRIGWPSNVMLPPETRPSSESITPEMAFSVVLLPAPLAPSRATQPRCGTCIDTPLSARMTSA